MIIGRDRSNKTVRAGGLGRTVHSIGDLTIDHVEGDRRLFVAHHEVGDHLGRPVELSGVGRGLRDREGEVDKSMPGAGDVGRGVEDIGHRTHRLRPCNSSNGGRVVGTTEPAVAGYGAVRLEILACCLDARDRGSIPRQRSAKQRRTEMGPQPSRGRIRHRRPAMTTDAPHGESAPPSQKGSTPMRFGTPVLRGSLQAQGVGASSLPALVDIETVSQALGISTRQVRRFVAQDQIPFVRVGHLIRFDPNELSQWLDAAPFRISGGWRTEPVTSSSQGRLKAGEADP